MNWISFLSQTGSEVLEVSKQIGRYPDSIIVNKQSTKNINKELLRFAPDINFVPNRYWTSGSGDPEWFETITTTYDHVLNNFDPNDAVVTLNGWLKIVPEEICDKWNIYNGHPGLITKYPELKGKDPQIRAIEGDYETAGCVIHKAVAEVDGGEIISEGEIQTFRSQLNMCDTDEQKIETGFNILHEQSIKLWVDLLSDLL